MAEKDMSQPTMGLLKLRNPSELLQQPQQGETNEIADPTAADENITIKLEVVDSEDDSEEDEAEAADLAAAQAQLEERKSTDEMEEDFMDALASFEDDIKEEEGQGNDDIGVDPRPDQAGSNVAPRRRPGCSIGSVHACSARHKP